MTTEEMVVDVSHDWVLACDVQSGFMQAPRAASDSFDYSARCRQVRALGGDYYNFIPLKDDRLGVVVGDASGKGLAAALMIANVQSSLRTAALFTGDDLAALLKVVNHQTYASSSEDRYATLFYGVFDVATRILRYVNAGHNPPVVIRRGLEDLLVASWHENHILQSSSAKASSFPASLVPSSDYRARFEPSLLSNQFLASFRIAGHTSRIVKNPSIRGLPSTVLAGIFHQTLFQHRHQEGERRCYFSTSWPSGLETL